MKALDTGLLDFEIEFKNGDKGVLSFNPNDIMFYDELAKLESKMKEIYSEYENFTTVNESNVGESLFFRTHKPVPQLATNLEAAGVPYWIIGNHIFYYSWVNY
jgi:hypothetical protein